MSWTYIATVASESDPSGSYDIKRATDGRLGCDCTAYRFARREAKTCKHIRALLGLSASVQDMASPRSSRPSAQARVTQSGETFTITRRAISFDANLGAAS